MKKSVTLLLVLFSVICAFGQNIDWINAPLNPIPQGADLKYHNLKGDVLQGSISNYFTRDGNWFSYGGREVLKKDTQGRIVEFIHYNKHTYSYKYDDKGNLVSSSGSTYEYDNKNRLIKVNHKYETSQYSYKNQGDLLIITEISTFDGKTNESEHHYKNGLKILLKSKDGENLKYEYTFDAKGNWVSMTTIDVATNKPWLNQYTGKPLKPKVRNIIYYSDYDKGLRAITVQLKDLTEGRVANAPLVGYPFINGKQLERQFIARLTDDYVFYEPIANTYYIARNTFLKTNTVGQKIPVEKLISGQENILLFNGKNIRVVEKGDAGDDANDWQTTNYSQALGSYISFNNKTGGAYAFENMPTVTDGKTVAVIGKPIKGIWYVLSNSKNDVRLFDNGVYINGKYSLAGYLVNTDIPVITIEETKKHYVLSDYDKAVDKKFAKVRLFNPATDNIQTQKASSSNSTTTNTSNTNSSTAKEVCISGNCTNGFGKKRYANGETLEGFFENGKANGIATHTLSNGNSYNGNFKDDYYQGYGIYYWKNEDTYYYGTWEKGQINGYGYQLKNNKAVVAGYYTKGKLVTNMLTNDYKNFIYKNNCSGNCYNGFGQYKYNQNSWYFGFFKDGKLHYVGTFKSNVGLYMGEFNTDKMEGTGMLRYKASGDYYVGKFTNGSLNGKGYKADQNLKVTNHGIWEKGKLVGSTAGNTTTGEKTKPVPINGKNLSPETKDFFQVYNSNPNNLKKFLEGLNATWIQRNYQGDVLYYKCADIIKEIYKTEPYAAFEFMMKMKREYTTAVVGKLPNDIQDYIREKSRERIKKYSGSYSTKTN